MHGACAVRMLSREWWQEDIGTRRTPRQRAPQAASVPRRRWQVGKWVLRAWHLFMLWAVVMGMKNAGGGYQQVIVDHGRDSMAHHGASTGMVLGLIMMLTLWALGTLIIQAVRKAF